jgi:hypothetical protein
MNRGIRGAHRFGNVGIEKVEGKVKARPLWTGGVPQRYTLLRLITQER